VRRPWQRLVCSRRDQTRAEWAGAVSRPTRACSGLRAVLCYSLPPRSARGTQPLKRRAVGRLEPW
jgi:hypothetical protein